MKSAAFLAAVHARETSEVILDLLTLTSPDLEDPLRLVNNSVDVVSRGETFTAYPFEIPAPGDREDRLPQVTLVMSAIYDPADPIFGGAIGFINTVQEATATLEWVLASAPNVVEYGPFVFTVVASRWDAERVEITLAYEDLLNAEWPGYVFSPAAFPALFAG